ncbi:MAG: WD40 domain-containing protein [Planctomycetota bacterium]|jgi:WD40 repeat protein/serine/threonine protein kinase
MREDEKSDKAQSGDGDKEFIPTISGDGPVTEPDSGSMEQVDGQIGPYKLLEVLGEGGYGIVYLAEQQKPIRREVALKVIKLGMDSKQVIARFEAERQTLALLDHPNIAHVFDAGTTRASRPYFVMEYVKGISLTNHCDQEKLSIEKRLELFLHVCEAVHYAHQKGIIHRDIKPSNILVSIEADKALPKIIDFGVAKALTQTLTERTFFTEQGQLIGTPEYMSPEQAEMANEDIDTRSDIYSLGVLLYTLLTGALPFDRKSLQKAAFAEILRVIREEDPPHPSTRLSSLGEEAKKIAENRRTELATLAKRLHKELEWIPLKAMRKERSHRYQSASELANDIRNYLSGAPLIAGPESSTYRLRKFVRRHQALVTGVAAVFVVLAAGVIVSMIFAIKAEQESLRTREESEGRRRALYFNRIALAETRLRHDYVPGARNILLSCPTDLRAWEWYYLWCMTDQSSMVLRGHADAVFSVAFSPDGKLIASGSGDRTIKIWDAATGTVINTIGCWDSSPVAFSPDGKRIVAGSGSKTIRVWDVVTGEELMTLLGHKGLASPDVFSPNGRHIISGSESKTIKICDVTGEELKTLIGHSDSVTSVDLSPDSRHIISGSKDKTIKIWDAETGAEVMTLSGHESEVGWVAFSPDGRYIISRSKDKTIKIWDAETGADVMTLSGHESRVWSVAFSPDGKRIISGRKDGTIKVWDAATGEELMTLRGHSDIVTSVAFSSEGKHIVSGSWDYTIKVWDAATGKELKTLLGHCGLDRSSSQTGKELMTTLGYYGAVTSVAFSPDGKSIVSGSFDMTVRVWDWLTAGQVITIQRKRYCVEVSISPDGKRIVSGSWAGAIEIYDAATGENVMTLLGHDGKVFATAFSPDGKRIVSGGNDETIKVWDAMTGKEMMTLSGHKGPVTLVAFSTDGKSIVSVGVDKTVRIWDVTTGKELTTLLGHKGRVTSVAFSPDGKRIISGSEDKTIKIWDVTTGKELTTLLGHKGSVTWIAFISDGKRIISGSDIGTVKFWDVETGEELKVLFGHEENIKLIAFSPVVGSDQYNKLIAFSPDGMQMASICDCNLFDGNSTIKVWDTKTGHEVITLSDQECYFISVAFSPNGKRIVSGSLAGVIKIWDVATGSEVMTLLGQPHSIQSLHDTFRVPLVAVYSIAFSPDGKRIVAGEMSGTIKIWNAASPEEVAAQQNIKSR